MSKITRQTNSYKVVCCECGSEYESEADWLENDPCMPTRLGDDDG